MQSKYDDFKDAPVL